MATNKKPKLKGNKTHFGYHTHQDYKEWGEQGGRPKKWASEAERKRASRLAKAQAQGKKLRGYRKYTEQVKIGTGELQKYKAKGWSKSGKVFSLENVYKCPKCEKSLSSSTIKTRTTEYGEQIDYCRCGYEPTKKKTIHRAGTDQERKAEQRKKIVQERKISRY
ncbi:MAG: hypothetical protein GBAus27B_000438 [Mycoplasmataceae bacterium]|nr:MAG: hypothetical protein GBAus27B_000438 [Mycoplasmataceae bacterium]